MRLSRRDLLKRAGVVLASGLIVPSLEADIALARKIFDMKVVKEAIAPIMKHRGWMVEDAGTGLTIIVGDISGLGRTALTGRVVRPEKLELSIDNNLVHQDLTDELYVGNFHGWRPKDNRIIKAKIDGEMTILSGPVYVTAL